MWYCFNKLTEKEQTCCERENDAQQFCLFKDVLCPCLAQKKAFDFISIEDLYEVLKAYGFKHNLINIIKLLYVQSTVQINVNSVLIEQIEIQRGVKQGCPLSLSPPLYILAINPIIIKKNTQRRWNNKWYNMQQWREGDSPGICGQFNICNNKIFSTNILNFTKKYEKQN